MTNSQDFEQLRRKRLRYIESARENGFEEGLRSLLAELYPDNAHFIYELLQNAEDARATVVEFVLAEDGLTVNHNGVRAFSLADIESITGIGKSTKKDDETQIGKFGVGFKAVFAYTTRPAIRSGEFSFEIADLFVPELIGGTAAPGHTTFTFPFNRPEKPADVARGEVERGLRALDEKTLLFLNSIQEITYALPDGDIGFVKRTDVDEITIQVEASRDEGFVESTWLRLVGPASTAHHGPKPLTVAAAFKVEPKEVGKSPSPGHPGLPAQAPYRIVPLSSGDVSIYFPAVKESSQLRFHIHAPFASTVARDSVRDTEENAQLVADIGDLIVRNLEGFRDRGLIDDGFLAALPNTEDNLPPIYGQIRSAVVEAFNSEAVTPVRRGGYGAARSLVSSPSEFRSGLDQADLGYLMKLAGIDCGDQPQWIMDRDGRTGRFLRDLDSIPFGWEELDKAFGVIAPRWAWPKPAVATVSTWHRWLQDKNDDSLLNLYDLLGHRISSRQSPRDLSSVHHGCALKHLPIVRLREPAPGVHVKGTTTHLPSDRRDRDKSRVPVELAYFDDDLDAKRSKSLQSFYQAAGVKRWDERTKIDSQLAPYRAHRFPADDAEHLETMKDFVRFGLSNQSSARSMFDGVPFILVADEGGRRKWAQPSAVFIDEPFRATGLNLIYADEDDKYPLPGFYLEIDGLAEFLATVGAADKVQIVGSEVSLNPKYDHAWAAGKNENFNTIKQDYDIIDFDAVVAAGDDTLLRSLWDAVSAAPKEWSTAKYRPNASYTAHEFASRAVQRLTSTAWIPSNSGQLRHPQNITLDHLPSGWPKPTSGSLAATLPFGTDAARHAEQAADKPTYASKLGIDLEDVELLREARAAGIGSAELQGEVRELIARKNQSKDFPAAASENPDRRAAVAASDARTATSHQTSLRSRSVVTGHAQFSEESKSYLREQYTNSGGDMYCQACHEILPFKVKDQWYFETIRFIRDRQQVHRQNALALCPLCAALYQYVRETTDDALLDALSKLDIAPGLGTIDLPVRVHGRIRRLRFTGKHALDLRAAMAVAGEQRIAD
ncbi:hypothetical protein AB0I35_22405 [Nocardia sp. NPDC050378]|uniref:sacsin N-terminal ATP-binding-like domain-containing protein n=1 Tax=Nocardia sp. NPDC050378 TaxID=3155400 RepID=UPI0033ECB502